MHTSRFQIGFIAALAMGLGFSLASSEAVGYPAGAAVSMGENPAWSAAGQLNGPGAIEVLSAPAGQDAMITDLHLSTNYSTQKVRLVLGDGTLVGDYRVRNGNGGDVNRNMTTGIRVPAGKTLSVVWDSGYSITYNLSGYFTQP